MLTHVEFRSDAFPPYDTESDEVNPGRFGKRLAEFLAQALERQGEGVGEIFAEDWWRKVPTKERLASLQERVDLALRGHDRIRDIKWFTHDEFNNPAA